MMGNDWEARFISGGKEIKKDNVLPAIYLRREFSAAENIKRAVLYIAGLGYFEARINGKKVGDDFLSTPYTAYDKNILYRAFDVTGMIKSGENAIGVILGNGFYNCFTIDPWQTSTAPWRDVPKLLAELHIEYNDHTEKIISDTSWKYIEGPIVFNGIRHGEEYDARLEKDGWDMPGYTGQTFPSRQVENPGASLSVMEMEPIRIRYKYHPVSCRKVKNGWLYEIEQNQAGVAHFVFRGKAGTRYKIRYCDRLHDDGELDQDSLSCFIKNYSFQTDVYTKKSDLPEEWNAIFTYHGFKYLEVSDCEEPIACEDIEAWSFSNDLEVRGKFTSSDSDVNAIQHMCLYSTTSCLINTFASDTVREKSSWTGDTGLSSEQLMINFGAEQFMKKWQQDLRDAQRPHGCLPCIVPSPGWGYNSLNGPDWSHPMVDVPWFLYKEYGDIGVLRDNYDALCRHVGYISSMANGGIASYGLGDWCPPFEGPAISVNMSSFKCPVALSDTAYYYSAVKMA
ncbi:MAG: family 78 glycoside hydrolase catalytic domain, partial [Eubacteriales bacterium]